MSSLKKDHNPSGGRIKDIQMTLIDWITAYILHKTDMKSKVFIIYFEFVHKVVFCHPPACLPAVFLEGPGDPVPKAFGIEKTGFPPRRVTEVTRLFSSANPLGRARE